MIERLLAKLGYVPQEHVDARNTALGDAQARADRAASRMLVAEGQLERARKEIADGNRVIGFLLGQIGGAR